VKLLTIKELKDKKGIPDGRRNLERKAKLGWFPKPIKLSPGPQGHIAWIESEIDEHLGRLAAQRDGTAAE
jgi:predicted DNA-binding transcriptional regulator AlpA